MNNSLLIVNAKTMSSREIAELTGSNHSDVKRSADRLCAGGVLTQPLAESSFEHRGNYYTEYLFNKRDSLVLVARLSPEFTAAVVDRWQELESSSKKSLPSNYIEALEALVESEKQKELMAPKAEFVDRLVDRDGLMNATQIGQHLGMSAKELNQKLDDMGVYNKSVKRSRVFQQWFIDKGYGKMKQSQDGYPQNLFTTHGQYFISSKLMGDVK